VTDGNYRKDKECLPDPGTDNAANALMCVIKQPDDEQWKPFSVSKYSCGQLIELNPP